MSAIKQLQTELAKDLVKFEESDLSEEQLDMIEKTYQQVYDILGEVDMFPGTDYKEIILNLIYY